jgi:hypothetical protein
MWVASKTGGLSGVRCEAGLVHTAKADWALCVCAKGFNDPVWSGTNAGSALISEVSRTIYREWGPPDAG